MPLFPLRYRALTCLYSQGASPMPSTAKSILYSCALAPKWLKGDSFNLEKMPCACLHELVRSMEQLC
jgi:hypothetical protein